MVTKFVVATFLGIAALVPVAHDAMAGRAKVKRQPDGVSVREYCRPYNGPYGYYGNPWCDGGWKYAEDYPPGSGQYFDILELPQIQRWWRE